MGSREETRHEEGPKLETNRSLKINLIPNWDVTINCDTRTGNFLQGAVYHLPKKFSQVDQFFMKQSKNKRGTYDALTLP